MWKPNIFGKRDFTRDWISDKGRNPLNPKPLNPKPSDKGRDRIWKCLMGTPILTIDHSQSLLICWGFFRVNPKP